MGFMSWLLDREPYNAWLIGPGYTPHPLDVEINGRNRLEVSREIDMKVLDTELRASQENAARNRKALRDQQCGR